MARLRFYSLGWRLGLCFPCLSVSPGFLCRLEQTFPGAVLLCN